MSIATLAIPSALLILAAASDLRWRIVPDTLCALLAIGGLFVAATDGGPAAALAAALPALAVFAGGALLFHFGQLGGGDVKLAAATALWLPGAQVLSFLVLTSIAGGAVCLAAALARFVAVAPRAGGGAALQAARAAQAPYAVAICIGALAALPWEGR